MSGKSTGPLTGCSPGSGPAPMLMVCGAVLAALAFFMVIGIARRSQADAARPSRRSTWSRPRGTSRSSPPSSADALAVKAFRRPSPRPAWRRRSRTWRASSPPPPSCATRWCSFPGQRHPAHVQPLGQRPPGQGGLLDAPARPARAIGRAAGGRQGGHPAQPGADAWTGARASRRGRGRRDHQRLHPDHPAERGGVLRRLGQQRRPARRAPRRPRRGGRQGRATATR